MAIDYYGGRTVSASGPAIGALEITPDDDEDLEVVVRGIAFSASGDLHVTMYNGEEITFPDGALAPGVLHPLRIRRVHATGTTAEGIIGVY